MNEIEEFEEWARINGYDPDKHGELIYNLAYEIWEQTKSKWQPIGTAPKDGRAILVVIAGNHPSGYPFEPAVVVWNAKIKQFVNRDKYLSEVDKDNNQKWNDELTHWMPLPEPPEKGN